MTYLRQENIEETARSRDASHWLRAAQGEDVTPELEDARRRFLLALRAMTMRREKEETARGAVQLWMETLEREIRAYRQRRYHKSMRRLLRLAIIAAVIMFFFKGHWGNFFWLWMVIGGGAAAADVAAGSRKEVASALARARDPRAVGVLAMACRDGDRETRNAAARGLISIMPTLQAGDAQYITPQGMDALIDILKDTKQINADLLIAIMKGLEQVGDARAIAAVEKRITTPLPMHLLLRGLDRAAPGNPVRAHMERVQQAACECLPYLQQRAEWERQRNLLLRPAQAPDDPGAILLRPAMPAASTTPPEQLLRPVMPEE
jgi:hypothetical protein